MMSQLVGEAMVVGLHGLVILGVFFFVQSLWRDPSQLFSGKDY